VPDKDTNVHKEFEQYVYERVPMMKYVPIVSASSLNRQRIHRVIDMAEKVLEERKKTIKTSPFNNFIKRILKEKPLPVRRGVPLKIKYGTQVKSNPPVFKFFMNKPKELPANYRRFIENRIRDEYGFKGVPITMRFDQK